MSILSSGEERSLVSALQAADQGKKEWKPAGGKDPFSTCVNRRAFLRGGAALFGGLTLGAHLGGLLTPSAHGQSATSPYGPISPVPDSATGLPLLRLPAGFRYKSWGWTDDPMIDGRPTPGSHDGMGVVNTFGGRWVQLIRNHERDTGSSFTQFPYDATNCAGGDTTFIFDLVTEEFMRPYGVLSGTIRNCAGGVTPWGTWLSAEETTTTRTNGKPHGYIFDVGAWPSIPVALTAMGRFSHEAVAIDPSSGIAYETEDNGSNSGFYRFIPNQPGVLQMGGTLQMLKIAGQDQFNTIPLTSSAPVFDVEWVTIGNPNSTNPSCFNQGLALNGARFNRLEGIWYGAGMIYFLSTQGGPNGVGQVFEYDPVNEKLRVMYASTSSAVLNSPDNLVVVPDGTLLMCEDNGASNGEHLRILNSDGVFTFAANNINFSSSGFGSYTRPQSNRTFSTNFNNSEWCGATFSPDGKWLFANIQSPGITFAITGPWQWS
jgi:secreted PhoX family phosphatase